LPAACPVKLDVYDLSGRKVETVLNKAVKGGGETVLWQPNVPTGVYIYRLETPHRQYSGKVVVAR
jgi:serine protease AprX